MSRESRTRSSYRKDEDRYYPSSREHIRDRERDRGSEDYYRSKYREHESGEHRYDKKYDTKYLKEKSQSGRETRDNFSRSANSTERAPSNKRKRGTSPNPVANKKRSSGWDQAPEVGATENVFQFPPIITKTSSPLNTIINTAQAKRLYVGNLPSTASEEELKSFFTNQYFVSNLISPEFQPIVSVQINQEKNYAFLDFSTPDLATMGLHFDGISYQNQILKIRRPRDYQGVDADSIPINISSVNRIISTNVADTPNKLFIGGLHASLDDEQVKELIGFFGELKSFHLVKDSQTNLSKGYAFFEYLDPNVTDRACRALNNKSFGGKTLIVQRAQLGAKTKLPTYDFGAIQSTVSSLLDLRVNVTSILFNNKLQTVVTPTNVLVLLNMISLDELLDKEEVLLIENEIIEECSKFGTVLSVVIPNCDNIDELDNIKGAGKIFVHFKTVEEACRAQTALALRKFNRRCVLTSYLDENQFLNESYDGLEFPSSDDVALEELEKQFNNIH